MPRYQLQPPNIQGEGLTLPLGEGLIGGVSFVSCYFGKSLLLNGQRGNKASPQGIPCVRCGSWTLRTGVRPSGRRAVNSDVQLETSEEEEQGSVHLKYAFMELLSKEDKEEQDQVYGFDRQEVEAKKQKKPVLPLLK